MNRETLNYGFMAYLQRENIPLIGVSRVDPRFTPEPEDNLSVKSQSEMSVISLPPTPVSPVSMTLENTTPPPETNRRRPFTCKDCQRSFNRKEHLQRHERIHTGAKPFACKFPGCGKTFSRCDNRDTHHQTHFK